jgi:hypothetical protein
MRTPTPSLPQLSARTTSVPRSKQSPGPPSPFSRMDQATCGPLRWWPPRPLPR